jgi:DNA-binding response OmpR family regulator
MVAKEILIVDDDKVLCRVMSLAFQDAGFQSYIAYHGDAALKIFAEKHPPIILLDVAMPGMDGFQVAAEIRKTEPPETHTIIVIMTAVSRSFFVSQEFDSGIDSYLTKPILSAEVVSHINNLMSNA